MPDSTRPVCHLTAVVQDVWPITGLAYVVDEGLRTWSITRITRITRSTRGLELQHLHLRLDTGLTVVEHEVFDLVNAYSPLN